MDAHRFDRLVTTMARRPTRRAALRLLAGSLAAGLLAGRRTASSLAQGRPDRDGDGLYDDDEVEVYGTNPDVADTDRDGDDDGLEVYNGTDPLTPAGGVGCGPGQANCGGVCIDVTADPANCGVCGGICGVSETCFGGICVTTAPPKAEQCAAMGLDDCGGYCCSGAGGGGGCLVLGSPCTYGVDECCGGACLYGMCTCSPPRDVCANGSTCCSGVCGGDGFCV